VAYAYAARYPDKPIGWYDGRAGGRAFRLGTKSCDARVVAFLFRGPNAERLWLAASAYIWIVFGMNSGRSVEGGRSHPNALHGALCATGCHAFRFRPVPLHSQGCGRQQSFKMQANHAVLALGAEKAFW